MTTYQRPTQIDRIYAIENLLSAKGIVPLKLFLDELGVTASTLRRDLKYMRDRLNLEVGWDYFAGGYCFLPTLTSSAVSKNDPESERATGTPNEDTGNINPDGKRLNFGERFYAIEQMLTPDKVVPLQVLLAVLRVSRSTFGRDLAYMRDRLSADIHWDRAKGGYYFGTRKKCCGIPVG